MVKDFIILNQVVSEKTLMKNVHIPSEKMGGNPGGIPIGIPVGSTGIKTRDPDWDPGGIPPKSRRDFGGI